ncbi:hypothetical protein B0H13DRAFT_2353959 [Mycena leptocephala]|nr:hypothetical protein B0H13DRAFT_2353959 [Mycena leptocephala]
MENDHHPNDDFTSNPTPEDSEFASASSHDGGIFSGSHHFTVAGGTFNNITKNYTGAPAIPSDFRIIPLGDIDLQHEILLHQGSAVLVDGRNALSTVAMYQGPGAEEEWREDIVKHMAFRGVPFTTFVT